MILHVETSTKVCSVALSSNGETVGSIEEYSDDFIHGEALTTLINAILDEHHTRKEALEAISIAIGPGSYTGLRIGLATAKGMCLGLGIPIIPISSLASLESLALSQYANRPIISVFDARRDEVFCRIRSAEGRVVLEDAPLVLDKESFSSLENPICIGEHLEKVAELTSHPTLVLDPHIRCSARGQVGLAHEANVAKRFANLATLVPNYTKEVYINQGIKSV
ncbi:MAG: tRNA (adenosine(37)-N6)-threonylcarbamoyltransferase complex dimerization subunit type 1 TsaB [Flavobacteriales bacterium]